MVLSLTPFTIFALMLQYSLWFVFFKQVLKARLQGLSYVLVCAFLFVPFMLLYLYNPFKALPYNIPISIMLFIELLLVFKDSLHKKMLALVCVIIPIALSELFIAAVVISPEASIISLREYYTINQQVAISAIFLSVQIVLLVIGYAVWFTISANGGSRIAPSSWFAFLFFPCNQYVLIAKWYLSLQDGLNQTEQIFLLVTILTCLIADITLLYIIYGNTKRLAIEENNKMLTKLIDMKAEYYPALAEQYENMRKLRHDIANHIYTIKILLDKQDIESAKSYANEIASSSAYTSSLGSCENTVVDAFLYSRIQQLKADGIEVSAHIALPEKCAISNSELISAFGNMLDNAEEACVCTDEKYIELFCSIRKGYIIITTTNPALPPKNVQKNRRIPELERGVGSRILNDLAKKYDGNFAAHFDNGLFTASLSLKEGEAHD